MSKKQKNQPKWPHYSQDSTKTVITTRKCLMCGEKFNPIKVGHIFSNRSSSKTYYEFCDNECRDIFLQGLI